MKYGVRGCSAFRLDYRAVVRANQMGAASVDRNRDIHLDAIMPGWMSLLANLFHAVVTPVVSALKTAACAGRRCDEMRALRRRHVSHARRLALPVLPIQDRLLRVVMDRLHSHIDISSAEFRANRDRMQALVDGVSRAPRAGPAGRRREVSRAPSRARQAAGARADRRADRSRLGVSRALAARGVGHVRRRRAGRRHRHRHRPRLRPRRADRRQRRHGQGRHLLSAHGQEAPARAGSRAAEPPALRLSRRFGRRVPADAGGGLSRSRSLRPHLLQPGAHVGGSAFRRSPS